MQSFVRSRGEIGAIDGAYRVGYLALIMAVALLVPPMKQVAPEYYFAIPLLGTVALFLGTWPLGASHLAADLRGVLGWALLVELVFLVLHTFDALVEVYRFVRLTYNYVDYGLFSVLAVRLFWFARAQNGQQVSWPSFDFLRPITGGGTSVNLLSRQQAMCGYAMMGGAFMGGCLIMATRAYFFWPAAFAILAMLVMLIARGAEIDALDGAESEARLREEVVRLRARVAELEDKQPPDRYQ